MAQQQNKDIESRQLLELGRTVNEQRGTTTIIRVVDWISKGKHYPQLEKREFFVDNNGDQKMGKAKGFTIKDLDLVHGQWNQIMVALGSKLPEHQAAGATPAQQEQQPAAAGAPEVEF